MVKKSLAIVARANRVAFVSGMLDELLFVSMAILMVPVAGFCAFLAADVIVAFWDMGHPAAGFISMAHAPFMTAGWVYFFGTISVETIVLSGLRLLFRNKL